jgi:hypothetical protein
MVPAVLLTCLIAADAGFVALHSLHDPAATGVLGDNRVRLGLDGGYPEIFGYAQVTAAAALLVLVHHRRPEPVYLAWSLVLLALLADDALTIHERVGAAVAPAIPISLGPRPQDGGELAVWAGMGAVLLAVIVVAWRRSDRAARGDSGRMLLLVALLGFFGFGVDWLHLSLSGQGAEIAGIVEDGGELMTISAILSYVLALFLRGHRRNAVFARRGAAVA